MKNKILITGATGGLGSKVIQLLKDKTGVQNLAVLVRDAKSKLAIQYDADGIAIKTGDYADVESLERAFQGIDILYFVSGGDDNQRVKLHKNVVDAAITTGIKHIVYTSSVRKDESDSAPLAALINAHIQTEHFIRASGIAYTLLRHNLYAEVIEMMIGDKHQLLKTKTIYLPAADGAASFVPKKDLAEAAVNILLNPSAYANKILEFNGSEPIAFSAITEIIAETMKQPIRYISPEVTKFEAQMNKIGLPHPAIEILRTFSLAIAEGEFDQRSKDIETVLGRKTRSLTEFLRETYS